jgi:hypothetical protein
LPDALGRRAQQRDRERFPEVKEHIDEDPTRFLDVEGIDRTMHSRIQGIDFLNVADAWIQGIDAELERGPRKQVIARLNQRKAWLEENGERPDRAGRAS